MATQIAPGIYWIDGRSNFYLCAEENELTLIDTGMPKRAHLVWALIAELGRQPSDLKRILVTHADVDHVGSLAAVQTQTGATVYAGSASTHLLTQGLLPRHLPWLIQFLGDLFFRYKAVPAQTIQIFQDGDRLPVLGGMQVLATPGHTLDHFSFYSPTMGILFAGDALNTRNGRLKSTPSLITSDHDAARKSAVRLLELAPAIIACGHGTPLTHHSSNDVMALFNELR